MCLYKTHKILYKIHSVQFFARSTAQTLKSSTVDMTNGKIATAVLYDA